MNREARACSVSQAKTELSGKGCNASVKNVGIKDHHVSKFTGSRIASRGCSFQFHTPNPRANGIHLEIRFESAPVESAERKLSRASSSIELDGPGRVLRELHHGRTAKSCSNPIGPQITESVHTGIR